MNDRDVEVRFREIMDAEFGPGRRAVPEQAEPDVAIPAPRHDPRGTRPPGVERSAGADPDGVMELPPPATPQPADPFNFSAAMDLADPTPDEADRFVPVPQPPMRPWRMRVAIGAVLMAVGVGIALLGLFGATLSRPMGLAGVLAAVAGLATLLSSAPRSPREPWDDGARV